jgi:hypothetical protein
MHRKIFLSVLLFTLLLSILSELPFSLKAGKQAQDSQLANGSVIIINETEYTWYGNFTVNENETVIIENCNFTVVDGSIVDYGKLEILHSTVQIRKAALLKYIEVYGHLNLSSSAILGVGHVQISGSNAHISIGNSELTSWRIMDYRQDFSPETRIEVFNSKTDMIYVDGIDTNICDSEIAAIDIVMQPWAYISFLQISNSSIGSVYLDPGYTNVEFENLHKGQIQNWTFSNGYIDLSIYDSVINAWDITISAEYQSLCLSNCEVALELGFGGSVTETVNLTLETGFVHEKTIYQENVLNITLYNSTIDSWWCYILAGGVFQFSNSNCSISAQPRYMASVILSNSTIAFLSVSFRSAGTLTVTDSQISVSTISCRKGYLDLVVHDGYQDYFNIYNEQQDSNVTMIRTTVNYWCFGALGNASLSIHDSTLALAPPRPPYLYYYTATLMSGSSSKICVYDSNIEAGRAAGNSSFMLVNSTMKVLYAYDNANVTVVDSMIDTLIKDPPTMFLIRSQIGSDISLSFQLPDDLLSTRMLDDSETPLPPDIRRFSKYLQVDTTYDDLVDAQVRMYYNETEVSEAAIDERGLRLYYLDQSGMWQPCQRHGVNIKENFAWANVTKFSCFAVGFGSHHDLAVVDGSLMKTVVGQGFGNALNVTVMNQGVFSENSNLTVYANATVIDTVETVAVEALDSLIMTFNWSTTDLARGNYAVTACVWPVTNESDIEDNSLALGNVYVGVPGDVNADGVVELMDFYAAGIAYLSTPEKPNWNPNADINNDGVVEMMDFFIMSQHYLEHT